MKLLKIILNIVFIFQVCNSYATYYKLGDYQSEGRSVSLDIHNDNVYTVKYFGLMEIINISDPESPQLVGSIQLSDIVPGVFGKIIISDTLAFILGNSVIHVVNVTNPENPFYETSLDFGKASDIIIVDNLAYIAGQSKFSIVDILDIHSPKLMGEVSKGFDGICKSDTLIYGVRSCHPDILHIISIADPQNPFIISSTFDLPIGSFADIGYYNSHVFITNATNFWSINVTNPANPIITDTLSVENNSNKIYIENSKAIINNSYSGIKVIDITNPEHLVSLGYYDAPGTCEEVVMKNDIAYISTGENGIDIIDIADNTNPNIISSYQNQSRSGEIDISDNYVYLANNRTGMEIIDIADIYNPQLSGTYFEGIGTPDDISINNNNLCFSKTYPRPELLFIDISTPDAPEQLSQTNIYYPDMYGPIALFQTNTHAFVGSDKILQIYDISDFSNPIITAEYATTSQITDIIVENNICYISTGEDGIDIIDIENVSMPHSIGSYNTSGTAEKLLYHSEKLIIADGKGGFNILDVSNPSSPILLESIMPNYNSNIVAKPTIIDNKLIIIDKEWNEIFTYNISDFSNIQLLTSLKLNCDIYKLIHYSNYFLCSINYYGMIVLEDETILSINENEPTSKTNNNLNIYPNPFINATTISYSLEEKSHVIIEVFNQTGAMVKNVINKYQDKGTYNICWDGTDNYNHHAPTGIYIIKLSYGIKNESRKIVITR